MRGDTRCAERKAARFWDTALCGLRGVSTRKPARAEIAEGWALDKICSYTVKNGCDATQEEDEESRAALHAFQQEHAETDDKPADLPESDAPKQMRILVVEPTKDPYVKEIDGSLASMQAIVGGFIQAVEPFEDHNVLLVCNVEA